MDNALLPRSYGVAEFCAFVMASMPLRYPQSAMLNESSYSM